MLKLRSLLEDADPNELDPTRFPTKLSQVDPSKAKDYVAVGPEDGEPIEDDRIKVVTKSFSVQELKPSQSSMNINKALAQVVAMLLGKMPMGGNLGAFISIDNHIMDGHHRWVATGMIDPNAKVGGYQVNFPGDKLIPVLNALTAGKFGKTQGKAATGGFDQFKEAPIRATLEKYSREGIPNQKNPEYSKTPEDVAEAINIFTNGGTMDDAVAKFVTNVSKLNFELPTGAPSREDMPVIDGPDVTTAVNALTKGEIDVNPPYKESVQQKFKRIARI